MDVAALHLCGQTACHSTMLWLCEDVACTLPHAPSALGGAGAPAAPSANLAVFGAGLLAAFAQHLQRRALGASFGGDRHKAPLELLHATSTSNGALLRRPFRDLTVLHERLGAAHGQELGADPLDAADLVLEGNEVGLAVVHGQRVVLHHVVNLQALQPGLLVVLRLRGHALGQSRLGLSGSELEIGYLLVVIVVSVLAVPLDVHQCLLHFVDLVHDASLDQEYPISHERASRRSTGGRTL
mmetsp:Transcript_24542/g.70544  ORF Transcript_24542/g.70544 Transcript_24542/m.70544 type:complete len:241 (-) Transcript_24542:1046-1768(-)